jgi:N-sulfoglucosamine sulfohydrolase
MSDSRPNVLLLIGEDTGLHLGCYGDPDARTPTLDGLARSGMLVSQAFTHCPVCAPSRSGLVTGRYAYSYGTHQMRSTLIDPPPMFTRVLKDAGYHVSWPSKTDFNFAMRDREITDTVDWQKQGFPSDGPWFCYTNIFSTHESKMWPHTEDTAKAREALAPHERRDPATVRIPPFLPDTPNVRGDLTRHHENATVLDHHVADILKQLDESGQADNTIVIFAVDHGAGIPRGKRWCYDLGVHMPLIVRWPGAIKLGTVHPGLVAWVDLAPTILSWCGLDPLPGFQGRVFWGPAVNTPEREFCFGGRDRMGEQFDRIRFARGQRYHYIRNYRPDLPWAQRCGYMETMLSMQDWRRCHAAGTLDPIQAAWFARTKPEEELYDSVSDPWMVHNLAEDPAHAVILAKHRAAVDAHLAAVGDLGEISEWELIRRGLVVDHLREQYRSNIASLPEPFDNLGGPWDVDGGPWPPRSEQPAAASDA